MIIIAFNKPFNVVCQFRAHGVDATLAEYIVQPGMHPAGRLDKDSEGLLLLTDDGALQARITDPQHKLPKGYWVQVEGIPDEAALATLRAGVMLKDGRTRPAEVELIPAPALWPREPPIRERKQIPTSWLDLTIHEGRNRQVRRMTAAIGYPTLRLVRYRIGPWYLNQLQPGAFEEREVPFDLLQDTQQAATRKARPKSNRQFTRRKRQ